ncbi:MAG TPA: type IX secretion system plug protein domain-containing protein [Bacteroidota bacterium]
MKHSLWIAGLMLTANIVLAQEIFIPKIKGLQIHGEAMDGFPVTGLDSSPVLIEFDLDNSQPEDYRVKFYQCDKDWNTTENQFINDEMRNSTKFPIPFEHAPAGVQHYVYHYTLRVPGFPGIERFAYSGNYVFEIWDRDLAVLQARGRFFVAEHRIPFAMSIRNRYLPSTGIPLNQVNKIQLAVALTDDPPSESDRIVPNFVRTVDIYKNREVHAPYRIDVDDNNPHTFVDGFGTPNLVFSIDNIQPGNEYRHLDITDVDFYPADRLTRARDGADVGRVFHQGPPDNDGEAVILANTQYSDYVKFQFELDRETDDLSPVYVVGDFNDWLPGDAWKMSYDAPTARYVLQAEFRRGVYDYQYVSGGNDWRAVEGNDWRTVNQFTALLYCHDMRFGGFDRIIGVAQGTSPGGTQASTN